MPIAIISDTHGFLGSDALAHLQDCDEVWHAGDFGNLGFMEQIKHKRIRGVYGNIDSHKTRSIYPENLFFHFGSKKILMRHIVGNPGKYTAQTKALLNIHKPDILICGHSHILRVQHFPEYELLHINPGAIGKHGFHKQRTLIKFDQGSQQEIENMRVIDLGPRA